MKEKLSYSEELARRKLAFRKRVRIGANIGAVLGFLFFVWVLYITS